MQPWVSSTSEKASNQMNFPIEFDPKDKRPMYQQLSEALESAIRAGRLKPGDHLPSTRDMAAKLSLARGTIVKAYEELLNRGYLEGKTGTGTKVVDRSSEESTLDLQSLPEKKESASMTDSPPLSQYGQRLLSVEIQGYTSADLPNLNYGCAPQDLLPVQKWRELLLRYCRPGESHKFPYVTETFGYRPLREAFCNYLKRTKAVRCHPDQIIIFTGSQQALDHIVSVLVDVEDKVIVENPGYVGVREKLVAHGARIQPIPVDEQGLNVDLLESLASQCKLIHTTPTCHDPTGIQMSLERRVALLKWAKQNNCMVVEDAWDTDYTYGGPTLPSLQGMTDEPSVVYLYSLFKVLFPLITLAVAIVPPQLIPVFTRAKLLNERQVPALEYYALTDFINEGHLDAQIRRTQKIYQKRRQALMFALSTSLRDNVTISPKTAGLHLTVKFRPDWCTDDILNYATEAGVPLVSTTPYYVGAAEKNEFLIAFSNLPEETTPKIIQTLAKLLGC